MNAEAFWDGVAKSYAERPIQNTDQHERTVARAASYLGPDARVLEVGCGTGTIALKLAPHAAVVLATDLSGALLDIARQRAADAGVENVGFARHAVDDLPEGGFDAVMSFNVVHLIEDMDGALGAMASRVRPGGVLVLKTGCLAENWTGRLLRPVIGAMRLVGKAPFVAFRRVAEVEAAVERQGLRIVEAENMGGAVVTRFLVAEKPA
ncbi:methyltransferase, UbiE/COQ5 family protein [Pseudooceanicola batsensis HTCC2597]|uniref:Methyltransferase, UbiE/COQ5 family protein n=1 Tax=Pseudooceanicola batsensis (strain ATCC BAA-863 / DSM 15984 / KCTC 12145 / HTCC2597) TaxID=252305 RepID=A3TVS9_PSEBH|nr:class I SAM-dependent methyltransferase [Pseudooceanicola batsensis]EAQ03725.1 methyltransferase, UbiE/COQ5 family protein [Pseudooceanicola batsensis HTCC2597]